MSKFGDRLKSLRTERRYSQQKLADRIGMSKSSINMYERGEREPGLETLETLADLFNCDLEYLVGTSTIKNKYQQGAVRSTPDEHLLDSFHQLNSDGQELAIDYVDALAEKPKYQRTDEE